MAKHRPYANGGLPSVTQVVGMMSAPGLSWGAARETAAFAVHHTNAWMDLPVNKAVDRIYRHHRGVWDHRALLGSAVHTVNAEWCQGHTVRVLDVVQAMREDSRLWRETPEQAIYADLLPMTDGLARAWTAMQPETLSYEQVVRYPHPSLGYIGTYDWRCRVGGHDVLLDLKTTGKMKVGYNKYWDSWRLQLAGYKYATEGVIYDDDGTEKGTIELPEVTDCAVLHIYGNGVWQLDGLEVGPTEHDVFLALRKAHGWRAQSDRPGSKAPVIVGAPAC